MMLSEHIRQAQQLLAEHGDLEMLSDGQYTPIDRLRLLEVEEDDQFPADWNMPKGSKFVIVEFDY